MMLRRALATAGLALLPPSCAMQEPRAPVAALASSATMLDRVEIRSERLASGLRVVLARIPAQAGAESRAYVASYVGFGAMDEDYPGQAHLIEHVVANSPAVVAAPPAPAEAKVFEGNALTRANHTSYVVVVSPAALERWIHSRLARLGRTAEDSKVYEHEVGRVVAELRRNLSGQYLAHKALSAMARGHSPRLTDEIAAMEAVAEARLKSKIREINRPDNAVLVVSGDIDLSRTGAMIRAAEQRLRLKPNGPGGGAPGAAVNLIAGRSATVAGQNLTGRAIAGLAWPQPTHGSADLLAFLVADRLLLGGRDGPSDASRAADSPLGRLLAKDLGAMAIEDGRDPMWGAPPLSDLDPSLHVVQFSSDRALEPAQVREAAMAALRQIRRRSMSDSEVEAARDGLARFYERWFLEPTFRILSDHLAAWSFAGRDVREVLQIPARIRTLKPSAVRRAFDRYLLGTPPLAVVLPPAAREGE